MVNTPQLAPSASTSSTSKLLIARKRYCFYLYYHTHSLLVCIHTYPVTHSVEYSELRTETLVDRVRDWTFHYSAQAPYSHKSGSETNDQQTTSLIAHPPTHSRFSPTSHSRYGQASVHPLNPPPPARGSDVFPTRSLSRVSLSLRVITIQDGIACLFHCRPRRIWSEGPNAEHAERDGYAGDTDSCSS